MAGRAGEGKKIRTVSVMNSIRVTNSVGLSGLAFFRLGGKP